MRAIAARLLALLLRRHDLDAGRLDEPDLHRIEHVGDGPEDARLLGRARLVEVLDGRERLHGLHPGGFRRARREVLAGYARELELRPIFRDDGEVLEGEAAVDLFHRGRRRRLLGVDARRLGHVDIGHRQPAHGARARALAALHLHGAALARRAGDAALGDVGDDDVAVAGRLALVGEGLLDHGSRGRGSPSRTGARRAPRAARWRSCRTGSSVRRGTGSIRKPPPSACGRWQSRGRASRRRG